MEGKSEINEKNKINKPITLMQIWISFNMSSKVSINKRHVYSFGINIYNIRIGSVSQLR